jgi:hypothetical protein
VTAMEQPDLSLRFFDNREKYLQFVSTCNEKQLIARRVAMDIQHLNPSPPALRVFDAGMGDATVLTRLMRHLHQRYLTVPFLIVGKEISQEDVRIGLERMGDRFSEHPQTVLVITNMLYSEAPTLTPGSSEKAAKLNWLEVAFEGNTAYEFDEQIRELEPIVREWWETKPSERTGNPVYAAPSVIVIYRKDQRWPLAQVIPKKGNPEIWYDLILAAQPFRASQPAPSKVKSVLAPLAQRLAQGGSMVVVQSTGKDPGMEIIRTLWPDEDPFQTPRFDLLRELRVQLGESNSDLRFLSYPDSRAEFQYELQLQPEQTTNNIGTSTLLAAWNAATYVAQTDEQRLREVMGTSRYLDVTQQVLHKYNGLWFNDESFIVSRVPGEVAT